MKKQNRKKSRNKTITAWVLFVIALLASLVAENFVHVHAVAGVDGKMFFHAWFGFITCVIMVLFSKLLGFFLKRQEDYYKENRND